jgi:hypothetical protein
VIDTWEIETDLDGQLAVDDTAPHTIALKTLELSHAGDRVATLQAPTEMRIATRPWRIELAPSRWAARQAGLELAADVAWPARGHVTLSLTDIDLPAFQDLVEPDLPAVQVAQLTLETDWADGPATVALNVNGTWQASTGRVFSVTADLTGDSSGLDISRLELGRNEMSVVTMAGHVPGVFSPAWAPGFWRLTEAGSWALEAELDPSDELWDQVGAYSGVYLAQPELGMSLHGPATAPQGVIKGQAAIARWHEITEDDLVPVIQDIAFHGILGE